LKEWREIRKRIDEELVALEKEVGGVRPLFQKLSAGEPDEVELRAAALTLHGFYNGVEAVFLIIARKFDASVPDGFRWHRALLDQMRATTTNRPAVIDQQLYDMLLEYLSFRHMVRHTYPGTLVWEGFREIAASLPEAHGEVDRAIRDFVARVLSDPSEV
jgi:hypothetical protein